MMYGYLQDMYMLNCINYGRYLLVSNRKKFLWFKFRSICFFTRDMLRITAFSSRDPTWVVLIDVVFRYVEVQYMGFSKNRGTPKWMVYNGKPY